MTFSACSFFKQDKDAIFNGEENITFADLSHVPAKEFQVLEKKIDSKLMNYCKELQELVREPVLCDILDDCDPPRGSVPFVGCTEQPSPTVTCERTLIDTFFF
jgi:hypothetical protein